METHRKHYIFVVVAAVLLVITSVATTLYTTGYFAGYSRDGGQDRGYINVTFTDAVLTCHDETRRIYDEIIHTLVTDNHSSRIDHSQFLYKIFLKMDLKHPKDDSTFLNYVNCFVHTGSGKIRKYEVFENLQQGEKPKSAKTNLFGMPIEEED